ncbi:MAG: hypothetical protein PHR16_06475 [Methylovulum sp.]|nr:hypothetical protein [Methylovulum sp.]
MKTKTKITDASVTIYQEIRFVLMYGLMMGLFCITFGFFFMQIKTEDLFPRIFGAVFMAVGVLLLAGLPKYYAKMKDKVGAIFFEADSNGIVKCQPFDTHANRYSWEVIEKIIFAAKHVEKDPSDGTSYSSHIMLIYFKQNQCDRFNLIERSKRGLSSTPKGSDFITIGFAKQDADAIKGKLNELSNKQVTLISSDRVEFDYSKKIETIAF